MSIFALMATFLIDTAGAPISVENCVITEEQPHFALTSAECDLTNTVEIAIAKVFLESHSMDANRSVPWFTETGSGANISGGIEPGETIRNWLPLALIPKDASHETLVFKMENFRLYGPDGEPLN